MGTGPILCAPLLRKVDAMLLELLASLGPEEWDLQTVAPRWKVRDVAAHLLDTVLRKLSLVRDGWVVEVPADDLSGFIRRLNHEGVAVYRRLSPAVLISLMRWRAARAPLSRVARPLRAGRVRRELGGRRAFPELVRHGARIDRTLAPSAADPARRRTPGPHDSGVVSPRARLLPARLAPRLSSHRRPARHQGPGGDLRRMRRRLANQTEETRWAATGPADGWDSRIVIPQDIAWRVFTKGIAREEAERQVAHGRRPDLGLRVLDLTAIVA